MITEEYLKKTLEEKIEFIKKQKKHIEQSIDEEKLKELQEIYKGAKETWEKIERKEEEPLAVPIATDTYEMTREDNVLRRLSELHPSL